MLRNEREELAKAKRNTRREKDHFDREKRQLTELAATLKQRSEKRAFAYSIE